MKRFILLVVSLIGCANIPAQHLWWNLAGQNNATCLYGEITVLATQPTTYFCGANWHPGEPAGGYCGIQHNDPQERRTIFSIWDTSPTLHPKVTQSDPRTIHGRFGGEGEGGHTHMLWNWKTNETFQFFVRKQPGVETNTTDALYYVFDRPTKRWLHSATINSPNGGQHSVETLSGGVNSFLENFSGQQLDAPRLAVYRLWLGSDVADLKCLTRARGDGTWGKLHDAYFLASGSSNALSTVLAALEPQYGKPTFGVGRGSVEPLTDLPLAPALIEELKQLPVAAQVDDGVSCEQPSPEEMAKAAGVELPHRPWHVANVWWEFQKPIEHFESLEMDITIDRDVPDTYNLYISPCGIAEINGLQFYGGIQANINGWANATNQTRIHPGKGAIFSRWSSDKKTPIGLEHVRIAGPDCLVESAGYEGEFASVRRPFAWTKGTYTYQIVKGAAEVVEGKSNTWFTCRVKNSEGAVHEVGSLRFEGGDFTYWAKHSAFVEVYSTAKIPNSGIPKVNVTFSWPRVNGQEPALKRAHAYYPSKTGPAAPDCAWIKADGEKVRVEVGPIFKRDEAQRRHPLLIERRGRVQAAR